MVDYTFCPRSAFADGLSLLLRMGGSVFIIPLDGDLMGDLMGDLLGDLMGRISSLVVPVSEDSCIVPV